VNLLKELSSTKGHPTPLQHSVQVYPGGTQFMYRILECTANGRGSLTVVTIFWARSVADIGKTAERRTTLCALVHADVL
jgi:hypothetical protein